MKKKITFSSSEKEEMKSKIKRKDLIMPYFIRELIKWAMWPLVGKGYRGAEEAIKYCWLYREAESYELNGQGYDPEDKGLTKNQMFENWEKIFKKYRWSEINAKNTRR